jgi:hypothetical protein
MSVKHDFESSMDNGRSYVRPLLRKNCRELPPGSKSLIAFHKQNVKFMRVVATVIVFTASVLLLYKKFCAFKTEMLYFQRECKLSNNKYIYPATAFANIFRKKKKLEIYTKRNESEINILYRVGGTCWDNKPSHLIVHTFYSPTTVGVTIAQLRTQELSKSRRLSFLEAS